MPRSNTASEANPTLTFITRKLQHQVPLKSSDLKAAVNALSDRNDVSTLNLMLKQREYHHTILNTACQMAMQLKKLNFVALFLRHGATPSTEELVHKMIRFCEHPTIQQYLCGWSKEKWITTDPELPSMEWHRDYTKEKVITYYSACTKLIVCIYSPMLCDDRPLNPHCKVYDY